MKRYGGFYRIVTTLGLALTMFSVYGQDDTTTTLSPTPSTGAGPEYDSSAPYRTTFWREGDPGERLVLSGRVLNTSGKPVAGAIVDVWQADGSGHYHPDAYRGKLTTDTAGKYIVRTAVPGNSFGAKHIHMMVAHDSYGTVTTRVVFKGDPNLSEWDRDVAIVLEETRVKDDIVFVGTFDVVMPGR